MVTENAAVFIPLLISIPAIVVAVVTALTAKKMTAQRRERREARASASDVVPEVAAH
ncbi:hypothetical protein ACI3KS_03655 [Microbacterium sp. ZW T5_45]|uniref:hypothetical protein n=1 Tax=Microbacterium sp. ZW T5_45 TaxID=3378080 RepID=UPI003851B156